MNADKSLDDLIKERRSATRGRGRGRGAAGASGTGRGAARGQAAAAAVPKGGRNTTNTAGRGRGAAAPAAAPARVARGGGVQKPVKPVSLTSASRQARIAALKKSDLRDTISTSKPSTVAKPVVEKAKDITLGTKVTVTNLETSVSEEDMKELFETVGPTKKVAMVAIGVCEVIFKRQQDAVHAYEKFNTVHLDNRPMYIQVHPNESLPKPAAAPAAAAPAAAAPAASNASSRLGAKPRRANDVSFTVHV